MFGLDRSSGSGLQPTRPPSRHAVAHDSGLSGLSFPLRLRGSGRLPLLFPCFQYRCCVVLVRPAPITSFSGQGGREPGDRDAPKGQQVISQEPPRSCFTKRGLSAPRYPGHFITPAPRMQSPLPYETCGGEAIAPRDAIRRIGLGKRREDGSCHLRGSTASAMRPPLLSETAPPKPPCD
jgi:hypothetical protein